MTLKNENIYILYSFIQNIESYELVYERRLLRLLRLVYFLLDRLRRAVLRPPSATLDELLEAKGLAPAPATLDELLEADGLAPAPATADVGARPFASSGTPNVAGAELVPRVVGSICGGALPVEI